MKKVLAIILTVVMLFSMSITAFAAGAFISSPSNNNAPTLVSGKNEDEDCKAGLGITSYADRDKLSDEEVKEIEDAYDQISSTDDPTTLSDALKDKAKKDGVNGNHLGVSDLFHIGYNNCNDHDDHGAFTMSLDADTLENFFGLMRFDGKDWHMVDGAKVENGNLVFTSKELGTFAVVAKHSAPQTGEIVNVLFITTVVLGVALAVVLISLKKRSRA